MKPLSVLDTFTLVIDSKKYPMQGISIFVLDPSTSVAPFGFERVREHFRRVLPAVPVLRSRLVEMPLGLAKPVWVNDPQFDIRKHVHHYTMSPSAGERDLARFADRIGTEPVDWTRPLWDVWYVDGYGDGTVSVLLKMHHCTTDLSGGYDLISSLLDIAPDVTKGAAIDTWSPECAPTLRRRIGMSAAGLWVAPVHALRSARAIIGHTFRRSTADDDQRRLDDSTARIFRCPQMPFNRTPSGVPTRTTAWTSVTMDEVHTIRRALGGTVNDVGLALFTGALRRWLEENDALPTQPMTCGLAKDVREASQDDPSANVFDIMALTLPTNEQDAARRLAKISATTARAKARVNGSTSNLTENVATLMPPGPAKALIGTSVAILGERLPAPYNCSVSCLRASDEPVYLAGAQIVKYYMQTMPTLGVGLNCALVTYNGTMFVNVVGLREHTPELWSLVSHVQPEVLGLLAVARREP